MEGAVSKHVTIRTVSVCLAILWALRSGPDTAHPSRPLPSSVRAMEITSGSGGGGVHVGVTGAGSSGRNGAPRWSLVTIYEPYLQLHSGTYLGLPCITYNTVQLPTGQAATATLSRATALWTVLLRSYPLCIATRSSGPSSPSTLATALWQDLYSHQLPTPALSIPPGYGILNVPSYVVTSMPFSTTFKDQTPVGVLTITASAQLSLAVDGAPLQGGPYSSPGLPWPQGGISIAWTRSGMVEVTAVMSWEATWSLAGQIGHFAPVSTIGNNLVFNVKTLTAVRTH